MKTLLFFFLATASMGASVVTKLELKGGDPNSKKAYLAHGVHIWGENKFMTTPTQRAILLDFSNSIKSYVLLVRGEVDVQGKLYGTVGMIRPSGANFDGNGFFRFKLNGVSEQEFEISNVEVKGETAEITWQHGSDKAVLTIFLPENDDKLLLEFSPELDVEKQKTYMLQLLMYPSSYAGGSKAGRELRKREGSSATRVFYEDEKWMPLGIDEPWIFLCDKHFDPAANRGDGPCAVLFNPKQTVQREVSVSNYACYLRLFYPNKTKAALILWDFKGVPNDNALESMKSINLEF
ncbi:MAG: hypothetical protein WC340_14500 [Kiritimatiellia bacterium]